MEQLVRFQFNKRLKSPSFNLSRNCFLSNLQENQEWNIECLWPCSRNPEPKSIEIQRKSTAELVVVSLAVTLYRDFECVLRRDFIQLIKSGCSTTQIELEYEESLPGNYHEYKITGTLTIFTEGRKQEDPKAVQSKSLLELSSSFERLLDLKETLFSDFNFKCGADSFPVHKNILSVRSPVFAAMFTTEMKENQDNEVEITDISPHVLKSMLTYIYTGKTGEFCYESAAELLFAADKYQLQDLKGVCCSFLRGCMSTENVLNTLVLGYLHDEDMKAFAMDFICNTCDKLDVMQKSVEWKILSEERPVLAMEVLTRLVKSKEKKLKERKD